jgi:hypothetical protein
MNEDMPTVPRSIPPQPTVAWFLRDLVPDRLWREFDIGSVCADEIREVQRALLERGGRDAWLRFVEQTRVALPQLLSISLFETLGFALERKSGNENEKVWPEYITLHCRPVLSVYADGCLLPTITLHCHARLAFGCAGEPITSGYVLASTVVALRHARRSLIGRVPGEYFVPVPTQSNKDATATKQRAWFKGFGRPRF